MTTSSAEESATSEAMVLVGTTKGLFTLRAGDDRAQFELTGPTFPGEEVYATCIDTRSGSTRLFTGSVSNHWGPVLRRSDDLGTTWTEDEKAALQFPDGTDASLARIWQLAPGPDDEPDVMYAGVEPAALFRSDDGGRSFSLIKGLWDHPHRPQWQPGGGGMCLHTVLVHPDDPQRLLIAISAAGVYRSDDGGSSWRASNQGIVVGFLPDGRGARVRSVRAQGGARRRRPRTPLPPAPRWDLPQRRWRWVMEADDGDRRNGLRVPGGGPPFEAVDRLPAATRERWVPVHTRREVHRVADHRRRRDVGTAHHRACPSATPTSPCCATDSPPTGRTPPASTSAPARARSTRQPMTVTRGGCSPSTCPPCCRCGPRQSWFDGDGCPRARAHAAPRARCRCRGRRGQRWIGDGQADDGVDGAGRPGRSAPGARTPDPRRAGTDSPPRQLVRRVGQRP